MITIKMQNEIGNFGENKDIAKKIRIKTIMPNLLDDKTIVLDFAGVDGATQSFIHALIAEPIREFRETFFTNLQFKNCSETVKKVVEIVSEYMQESLESV